MKRPAALGLVALLTSPLPAALAQPRVAPPRNVVARAPGTWQPPCVASAGCPTPRAIPSCGAGPTDGSAMPVMDVATAWAQRFGLAGRRVRVAGRLRAVTSRCTEMACPAGACCNQCVARQELVGAASRAFELGADDDASFACAGDDSGLCCGTAAPRGDVVVRGVLRPVPESGGRWRIASPAPCAP